MILKGLLCMGIGGLIVQMSPIIVVRSESVECKIVIPSPFSPQKDSYVLIDHPHHEKLLVKKIIAVAGEWTPSLPTNPEYTPLKSQKIPKGFVFVAGTHPQSFDSRYEEFGLIDIRFIKYSVFSIF